MAVDPKQLKQGGKGGLKGSAKANLSGVKPVGPPVEVPSINPPVLGGGGQPPTPPPTSSTPAPIGEPSPGGQLVPKSNLPVPSNPTSLAETPTPRAEKPVSGFRVYENLLGGPPKTPAAPSGALGTAAGIAGNVALFANAVSGGFSEPGDMRLRDTRDALGTSKPNVNPRAELERYQTEAKARGIQAPTGDRPVTTSVPPAVAKAQSNFTTPPSSDFTGPALQNWEDKAGNRLGYDEANPNRLNISTSAGGRGTIEFADGRRLSQEQLTRLGPEIAFNASPEGRSRLAANAAAGATEAPNNEFANQLQGQINALTQAWNNAGTLYEKSIINRRLETLINAQTKLQTEGATSEAATNKLGFEFRKAQGEQAFKGEQERNKLAAEAAKTIGDLREKNLVADPNLYASILKQSSQPISKQTLGLVLKSDEASQVMGAGSPEDARDMMVNFGLSREFINEYLNNTYNQ